MRQRRTARATAGTVGLGLLAAGGLPTSAARAYPGLPPPKVTATVYRSAGSEKLACEIARAVLPSGARGILAYLKVPSDGSLRSVRLRTVAGELPLEVTESLPLVGEYETFIDAQRTSCATSGTLLLEVEGTLDTKTAVCPAIVLPRASECNE